MNKILAKFVFFFACLMLVSPAIGNMGITIGYLLGFIKVSYYYYIPLTLAFVVAVEALAIGLIFKLNWKRSFVASIAVNVATAVLGIIIYPLTYEVLEPVLAPIIIELTGGGDTVEVIAIIIGVSLVDTAIELLMLVKLFHAISSWIKGAAFLLANLLTTTPLFYTVL